MDLADVAWRPTVKREESVLFGYYVLSGITYPNFSVETGLEVGFSNRLVVDHQVYMDSRELDTLNQVLQERPLASLEELADRCQLSCDRLLGVARAVSTESSPMALSDEELLRKFQRYSEAVIRHAPFLIATLGAEAILDRMVRPQIASRFLSGLPPAEEVDAYVRILSPLGVNYITHEIDSVAVIANAVLSESEDIQYHFQGDRDELLLRLERDHHKLHYLINAHQAAYSWLNRAYYLGSPSTKASLIDRVGQRIASGEDLAKVVLERLQRPQLLEAELASMLARYRADEGLIRGLQLYRRFLFLRTHRLDCYFLADHLMMNVLNAVAARIGLDYAELVWMTHTEIEQALQRRLRFEPGTFLRRRTRHAMILAGGEASIYDTLTTALPVAAPSDRLAEDVVTGTVAFPGKATGRARIVRTSEDAHRVSSGDILLAAMTTPEHIAAMERAAAFVTDEGGVACHAALIARDLRKPCLIDTRNATASFQDGDLIELDTSASRVRLIDRSGNQPHGAPE